MIMLLIFNHVFGTFPFLYIFLTILVFPTSDQLYTATTTVNFLSSIESILVFASLHLRYCARFLVMPNQSTTLQSIIGDIPEVYKNKTYKFKLHRTLLILICDTISALAQTSIFYFSCNYNAYGELSLNYYAIYLGTPAFFVLNFAAIHICGKFFYKDIFEGDNNLRRRYRKTTLFQIFAVLIIGAFMGLVIHFIFWVYDVSRNFISSLDP